MSSSWIHEPETGRYYMNWRDEYGRTVRRYSEELEGQSASSSQLPSGREQYETPRSESGPRGSKKTVEYVVTSSKHSSSKGRSRRESESFSRRPEPISEYASSQPIAIRKESSKKYHDPGGYDPAEEGTYDRSDYGSPSGPGGFDTAVSHTSGSYQQPRQHDWVQDAAVDSLATRARDLTLNEVVGSPRYPLSSTSQSIHARNYDDEREQRQWPSMADPAQSGPSDSYIAAQTTPQAPTSQAKHHIRGTKGDTEKLDASYKIRNYDWQKFFRTGRVFKTLWTDAYADATNPNDSENNQFMSSVTYVKYNQRVHSKIRRFVVVRLGDRCCQCLPVTTYDGRGYTKRGINLKEHGLIYSSEKSPGSVQGITKEPLKVKISKGAEKEKLVNPSYINYGRVYTVDTNVKVKDIGDLDSDSRKLLRTYYNEVNHAPDDDFGGPGPPQGSQGRDVEFAGLGAGVAGNPQGYFVAQPSRFTPSGATITSTSMRADYGQSGGYDQSSGYNQPSSGWQTTNAITPAGQNFYSAKTNYDSQTGSSQQANNPTMRYAPAPVYDMRRTSSSGYQPMDPRYDQQPTDPRYDQSSTEVTRGGLPASSYSSNVAPLYATNADTHVFTGSASVPAWSGTGPSQSNDYPQRGDYQDSHEQTSSAQFSSDPRYLPPDSAGQAQYNPNVAPLDTRSTTWSTTVHPASSSHAPLYEDEELRLPSLQEAQAARRPRRESVSTRSGARGRDRDRDYGRDPPRDRDRDVRDKDRRRYP